MQKFKYVIVGGGIAGTTAAETIRGKDPLGSVAIITDEPHPLYSRVMLSKPSFLSGKDPKKDIWLKTPDWYEKNRIELMSGRSVATLDIEAKIVMTEGEIFGYEKLLLAIGAHAKKWAIPGSDKSGVYYLRTLDEAWKIAAAMKTAKCAVVIGSSCVAFEAIENLLSAGIEVVVVMRKKYFWERMLGKEGGCIVEKTLSDVGVKFLRESVIKEIGGGKNAECVLTENGERIDCDMVLCGGITFPIEWVETAGIAVDHGIKANEYLETSESNIWAAGDIAQYNDIILDEEHMAGNWMSAREQGRVAGLNMSGARECFKLVSFYTSSGFGINAAFGGDIRLLPDRKIVNRGSIGSGSHTRLILRDGNIVGIATVNRVYELGTIIKLIQSRVNISSRERDLADENFELKLLL